jgi:hypothetical protein
LNESYKIKTNKNKFLTNIKMTNPLKERIEELCALSKAENPHLDDWYILLSVESYIRNEEPELLQYQEEETEEDNNKPDIQIVELPPPTDQNEADK